MSATNQPTVICATGALASSSYIYPRDSESGGNAEEISSKTVEVTPADAQAIACHVRGVPASTDTG